MSIETDLSKLTGSETVNQSLAQMGILSDPQQEFSIVTVADWARTGAETYSYVFDIICASPQRLILKACIALAIGRSIDTIVDEWIRRRLILESQRIATPRLFGYGQGMILEEYILYSLEESLRTSLQSERIATQLGYLASVLVSLGFHSIKPFHDLRSRGSDVVVVDFGEDLGPPGRPVTSEDSDCILRSLAASLESWHLPKRKEVEVVARQAFREALKRRSLG